MRRRLSLSLALLALSVARGEAATLMDAASGAPNPNGAPTRAMTVYSHRSIPKHALAIVSASWSCPWLQAKVEDNLGSRYRVLSGAVDYGPMRVEHWFTVTGSEAREYLAPRVMLSGTCSAVGRAFNSLYVQMAVFDGVDQRLPIDIKMLRKASGDSDSIRLTSGAPGGSEMLVVIVVTAGVGAPFTLDDGWTGWMVGEAVAANAFKRNAATAQSVNVTAERATPWVGVIFGVRSGKREGQGRGGAMK